MADRIFQVGLALFAVAGSAFVALLVYALENDTSVWNRFGWTATGLAVFGALLVVAGFRRHADDAPATRQHQHGGRRSKNLQAGRDINARRGDES